MTVPPLLADDMLARLARWLRGAGLDVAYLGRGAGDPAILRRAREDGRIVLTRDSRFPGSPGARIVIESTDLDDQLVEVFRRFPGFDPLAFPFSRCMECNGPVREEKDRADGRAEIAGPFMRCDSCGRLFWEGSHVDRIRERLARAKERTAAALEEERRGEPPPFERREYDLFLHELFPLLGLAWRGYRRVRFGLRSRIRRRMRELGLRRLDELLARARRDEGERKYLGSLLSVTISRFFRDREAWRALPARLFPELVRLAGSAAVRAWSLGCASGEEPYTLRMVWESSALRERALEIEGADLSAECLRRAARGIYPESSIHTVPDAYRERFFRPGEEGWRIARRVVSSVSLRRFDWRGEAWPGRYHWILARNGIFTYLDDRTRRRALEKIAASLEEGGFLWIGGNERLPGTAPFEALGAGLFRLASPRAGRGES